MYDKEKYAKEYYQKHKEELLAANKVWRTANRERRKKYLKEYDLSHPATDKDKERASKYYAKTKDKRLAYAHTRYKVKHEDIIKYQREYYSKNKAKIRARDRVYFKKHKDKIMKARKEWVKNHKEFLNEQAKNRRASYRLEALKHYSNGDCKCACCGETVERFLTIDHINNDGAKHRKEIGWSKGNLWAWLRSNNYPEGYQVLCFNCNCGRQVNGGVCPHKDQH